MARNAAVVKDIFYRSAAPTMPWTVKVNVAKGFFSNKNVQKYFREDSLQDAFYTILVKVLHIKFGELFHMMVKYFLQYIFHYRFSQTDTLSTKMNL